MKLSILFVLTLVGLCWTCQCPTTTFGHLAQGDRVLRIETVQEDSKFLRKAVKDWSYNANNTIRYIRIVDKKSEDKCGEIPTIQKGGVGRRNVTLHLKSQRGKSFKYDIEIYGY